MTDLPLVPIGHHFVEYHSTSDGNYRAVNADNYSGNEYFLSPGEYAESKGIVYVVIFIF